MVTLVTAARDEAGVVLVVVVTLVTTGLGGAGVDVSRDWER